MTDEENLRLMWSEQQLDQALATLNADVPPGARSLERARAELMAAAEATAEQPAKRRWGRWIAAVGTVAAVAAGVLMVQTVPIGDQPAPAMAAADVLNMSADRIGASDPAIQPGQYRYIESHEWHGSIDPNGGKTLNFLREQVFQTWVPYDRTQEWLQRRHTTGQRKWIEGTEADYLASGRDPGPETEPDLRGKCGDFYLEDGEVPCLGPGTWSSPTPEFLAALPTDPAQLYQTLREATAGKGNDPDLQMVVTAADALRSGLLPADVRATLYRALALMPSLQLSDQTANLDGRIGIGLGVDRAGRRLELIIDPANGQFIGERHTALEAVDGVPAGTVNSYTSVITGIVDNLGDKPAR